mgnify:CR=1 FL=1
MKFFLLGFYILLFSQLIGQNTPSDTLAIQSDSLEKHSPKKATYLSLALPGLGQAYNKKYWKIPLVYALIGVPLVIGIDQQSKFNDFKDALGKRLDDDPNTIDDQYDGRFTDQNLRSLIDFHRRNRDIFFILTAVAYALNVVDAAVDAHFYDFNVSDDLSINFKPTIQFQPFERRLAPALSLSLKFTKNKSYKKF